MTTPEVASGVAVIMVDAKGREFHRGGAGREREVVSVEDAEAMRDWLAEAGLLAAATGRC